MVREVPPAAGVGADLALFSRCAGRSAGLVLGQYSTSFGLACRLLDRRTGAHIRHVYALVRVADEIVDGAAAAAGLSAAEQADRLDDLEAETERALDTGFSTNLVVHAFALTARAAGIRTDLTRPFFASMRRDLSDEPFTESGVAQYIYGSAEVVGLMCLRCFLIGHSPQPAQRSRLEGGARHLAAAFQKVNFLRDLGSDWNLLGRNYFPTITPGALTEGEKLAVLADIDADLRAADAVIPELPRACRVAVRAAHGLFAELTDRLRRTPAADIARVRVSVPVRTKLRVMARAGLGAVVAGRP